MVKVSIILNRAPLLVTAFYTGTEGELSDMDLLSLYTVFLYGTISRSVNPMEEHWAIERASAHSAAIICKCRKAAVLGAEGIINRPLYNIEKRGMEGKELKIF